jgi:hypothetical protein
MPQYHSLGHQPRLLFFLSTGPGGRQKFIQSPGFKVTSG